MIARLFILCSALLLGGCELVDQLLADPRAIQREADAKAIGGGCRHGLRSIEDCYLMNDKASKSAIFDGWREMDQYMRENNIEGVAPKGLPTDSAAAMAANEEVVAGPSKTDKKSADTKDKPAPKADVKS